MENKIQQEEKEQKKEEEKNTQISMFEEVE